MYTLVYRETHISFLFQEEQRFVLKTENINNDVPSRTVITIIIIIIIIITITVVKRNEKQETEFPG